MVQMQSTAMKLNMLLKSSGVGLLLLAVLWLGGCAGTSPAPQKGPLPPPEHATPLAAKLMLEGNQRFAKHRWTAAIGKYEEAIQAQPKLAEAHYNLGLTLAGEGSPAAAIGHYQRAIEIKPDYGRAHNNLGAILTEQGEYLPAISHYAEAFRLEVQQHAQHRRRNHQWQPRGQPMRQGFGHHHHFRG